MIVGYACVVSESEPTAQQLKALRAAGCETIFEDRLAGSAGEQRSGLKSAVEAVSTFDSLVVCRLEELGDSVSDIVALLDELVRFGIGFRAIENGIDTTTQKGRLELPLLAALAAVDRARPASPAASTLVDRPTMLPRTGRKPKLNNDQVQEAIAMIQEGKQREAVARYLGVSQPTLRAALRRVGASFEP